MLVKVTKDSQLVVDKKLYKQNDELELKGSMLETQLAAGIVEEVKSKKEKK